MTTLLHKYQESFYAYKALLSKYSKEFRLNKETLVKYKEYITLYRALLVGSLVPGIILCLISKDLRNGFMMVWGCLFALTYLVESGLFVFQFTRKESFYVELILLPLTIAGAFVMM